MPATTYDPGYDEVREGQQVFRRLLDATAWPGKVELLPPTRVSPPPPWPAAVAQIARTLLDSQVNFAVHGIDYENLSDYLVSNTGARLAPLQSASYVIAGRPVVGLDVSSLHPGTLLEPDRGATLLLACAFVVDLDDRLPTSNRQDGSPSAAVPLDRGAVVMSLRGRGIAERRSLVVDQETARVMQRLSEREDEYPLGVDLILADGAGRVASLPRTTRWQREASTWDM